MIRYTNLVEDILEEQLHGFFADWPNKPSTETHLKLIRNSDYIVLAIDNETNNVVGFITAISDKVLSAYIPFLEVLPTYQKKGIGEELVRIMLDQLKEFYMIDLLCDEELQKFYGRFGMNKATGMMLRNYNKQKGV